MANVKSYLSAAFKIAGEIATSPGFVDIATHPEYSDQQRREAATALVTTVIEEKYPEYGALASLVLPLVVEAVRHAAQKSKKKDAPNSSMNQQAPAEAKK